MNPADLEKKPIEDGQGNSSDNMYSYRDENKFPNETPAIRRSVGGENPNNQNNNIDVPINQNARSSQLNGSGIMGGGGEIRRSSIVVQMGENPPLYWMFFLVFGVLQGFIILLIGFFNIWDKYNDPKLLKGAITTKKKIQDMNLYGTFQDINIMIFIGFGFLRSNLKHHSWSSIALNLLMGVLAIEIGFFGITCWESIFNEDWRDGIINYKFIMQANYNAATVIISFGAFLGKLSIPQYFISVIVETAFSLLNRKICEMKFKNVDAGGCLYIHLFGSVFGCAMSCILFSSSNEKDRIQSSLHKGSNYNSNVLGLFGTLIIWCFFPSFNTGSLEYGNMRYAGIINTYLALCGSVVGAFVVSPIFFGGKLNIEQMQNSTLAGGVIISGISYMCRHFFDPILIGFIAGGVSALFHSLFRNRVLQWGLHDTSGIIYTHGIPAFLGSILTIIYIGSVSGNKYWNNNILIDPKYGKYYPIIPGENRSVGRQCGFQIASLIVTLLISCGGGIISGYCIKTCNCNKAVRYFTDTEIFNPPEGEEFPWDEEEVQHLQQQAQIYVKPAGQVPFEKANGQNVMIGSNLDYNQKYGQV